MCLVCVFTYKGFLRGVLLRDGEVVVDEFGPVCLQLDGGPHHWVEISEIVVHVDAFIAITSQGPTCQLRALQVKESWKKPFKIYCRCSIGLYADEGTFLKAISYPSGFIEGSRWMRVSLTRRTMRWSPRLYSLHMYCIRLSRSSRPSTSFPCIPATYRNSGSPAGGSKTHNQILIYCTIFLSFRLMLLYIKMLLLINVQYKSRIQNNVYKMFFPQYIKNPSKLNTPTVSVFSKYSCTDQLSLTSLKDPLSVSCFVHIHYTSRWLWNLTLPPQNCLWAGVSAQSPSNPPLNTERFLMLSERWLCWIRFYITITTCAGNNTFHSGLCSLGYVSDVGMIFSVV